MKKLLTILLALLVVTGVVFADDPKLTLTAEVEGEYWHGFSAELVTTATDIKSATNVGPKTVAIVGGEGVTLAGQFLAAYNLYITQNNNVKVSLSSNWVLSGDAEGDSADWEVPYALTVAEGNKGGTRVISLKNTTIGTAALGTKPENPASTSSLEIFTTGEEGSYSGTGLGWTSVSLSATFLDNVDRLPEGIYTGTITALIDAL